MAQRSNTLDDFWRLVDQKGADECWPWKGTMFRNKAGREYGRFSIGGWARQATHWALLGMTATPKETPHVLHACDNTRCVNPGHLSLGTRSDNMRDMLDKGRGRGQWRPGEGQRRKLTPQDVREIRRTYARGGCTQQQLAVRYGVSRNAVGHLLLRLSWKSVE